MSFESRLEDVRGGFERSFWVANISELFERLSYYAAFAVLARYLHESLNFPTERAASLSGLFGGLVPGDFRRRGCRPIGISAGAFAGISDSGCRVFPDGIPWSKLASACTKRRATAGARGVCADDP